MKILDARLCNFRNHEDTKFEFGSRINVLYGENGMGKTNALEALSFLCLTKSFYASADATALQKGKEFFEIESTMESDNGKEFVLHIAYEEQQHKKRFTINNAVVEKLSSVLGMFPVVVLSPENNAITFGGPADRRRFVDIVISQSNALYVEEMLEYRRIVRQRNKILSELSAKDVNKELVPWTDMLIKYGARIVDKRNKFLRDFGPYIARTYNDIAGETETPGIKYAPSITIGFDASPEDIAEAMDQKIKKKRNDETRFQTSLVGPHRDEIIFTLNGMSLKHFASQGQHKTFLVALKTAEFYYLKERCSETPVLLFDDVFSELDELRSRRLLRVAEDLGQTFVTTTSDGSFGGSFWNERRKKFLIKEGSVVKETEA